MIQIYTLLFSLWLKAHAGRTSNVTPPHATTHATYFYSRRRPIRACSLSVACIRTVHGTLLKLRYVPWHHAYAPLWSPMARACGLGCGA